MGIVGVKLVCGGNPLNGYRLVGGVHLGVNSANGEFYIDTLRIK